MVHESRRGEVVWGTGEGRGGLLEWNNLPIKPSKVAKFPDCRADLAFCKEIQRFDYFTLDSYDNTSGWSSWLDRKLRAHMLVGDPELRHRAAGAASNFLSSNNNDWANHSLEAETSPSPQPQHDGSWWGDEEGRISTQNSHVLEWEAEKPIIFIIGPVACSITLPAYSEITQPPTSNKREKSLRTWPRRC